MKTVETQTSLEQKTEFGHRLDQILNAPLTPGTIDSYADTALNELVELAGEVAYSFNANSSEQHISREQESAAFKHYGLGDVEATLDHIADVADRLDNLDEVIQNITKVGTVIVPPDTMDAQIEGVWSGEYKEKAMLPRLKTTLFVLESVFDIDVRDSSQLRIRVGDVNEQMFRKASYVSLETPSLNRTVLVCDEEGNASFVVDTDHLAKTDLSADELMNMTKDELKDLFARHPGVGRRLIYSDMFADDMIELLRNPISQAAIAKESDPTSYLRPKPTEGSLTLKGIAKALGKSQSLITDVYESQKDRIGEGSIYETNGFWRYFDKDTVEEFSQVLTELGHMTPKAPEGFRTTSNVAELWGTSSAVVNRAVIDLGEDLGEPQVFSDAMGKQRRYWSEGQLGTIHQLLNSKGIFVDKASPEEKSLESFAKILGIAPQTLRKQIDEAGDEIGELQKKRFGAVLTKALSFEQQAILERGLTEKGILMSHAPEDVLSRKASAEALDIAPQTLQKTIDAMREQGLLGPAQNYRFRSSVTEGLTADERAKVKTFLTNKQ